MYRKSGRHVPAEAPTVGYSVLVLLVAKNHSAMTFLGDLYGFVVLNHRQRGHIPVIREALTFPKNFIHKKAAAKECFQLPLTSLKNSTKLIAYERMVDR